MSEIRCPIYGFITPSEEEFKIMNTDLFQRLRRIRQLAMAYLVYPGANHTRFDHSIGVLHVASLMSKKLLPHDHQSEKREIIRLAALLHDIGHGPFSHISEEILDKYSKIDPTTEKEKIHEKITSNLIENNKELKAILGHEKGEIIGLLSGTKIDITIMKEIVSGPLDADKMDYLLRDSYFCGVKYGIFDLHRLLNTLESYSDMYDEHIAVKYDGIYSLEQYVLAKYYITTQVYRHKVRAVTDAMITRGLELGIERDESSFLKKLYQYEDTDEYLDNYLNWWDDRVLNELVFVESKGFANEIFSRLYRRNLFKIVFSEKLKGLDFKSEEFRDNIINIHSKDNLELKKELEDEFSKILKCEKEYVIIDSYTIKSVKEMSRNSESEILIIDKEGQKKLFEDESIIFKSIDKEMQDIYFQIYAPITFIDSRDRYNKLEIIKKEVLKFFKTKEG